MKNNQEMKSAIKFSALLTMQSTHFANIKNRNPGENRSDHRMRVRMMRASSRLNNG